MTARRPSISDASRARLITLRGNTADRIDRLERSLIRARADLAAISEVLGPDAP